MATSTQYGAAEGDLAGFRVATIPNAGVLVGSPGVRTSAGETAAGAVYLVTQFQGGEQHLATADMVVIGEAQNDFVGWAIDRAGDLDADGADDLLIGAPAANTERSGKAYVFSSAARGSRGLSHSLLVGIGEAPEDWFGYSVAGLGDLDGDAVGDLLVGAPGHAEARGAAYFISGALRGEVYAADSVRWSADNGGRAGESVASIGDVDGDGLADAAVGLPNSNMGGTFRGAVAVIRGHEAPTSSALEDVATMIPGEGDAGQAGMAVKGVGDVDGDGRDDFMVGGTTSRVGNITPGAVFLVTNWEIESLAFARTIIVGEQDAGRLGRAVAGGDLDGDGGADLAWSAPEYNNRNGRVYVLFSPQPGVMTAADADVVLDGACREVAGSSLASGLDVDGDGREELFVGAEDTPLGELEEVGAAYLLMADDLLGR